MKSKIINNEKGFSLIELFIAMGLFAIGSLAVAALFYSTSAGIRNSNEMSEAIFIAEETLNQALSLRYKNLSPTPCASGTECQNNVCDYMRPKTNCPDGKYNVSVAIVYDDVATSTKRNTATITVTVTWAGLISSSSNSYTIRYIRPESKNTGV